jgi:hypothetical protein
MGFPPKSAIGLSGKRVDAMRAGIMIVKLMNNGVRNAKAI